MVVPVRRRLFLGEIGAPPSPGDTLQTPGCLSRAGDMHPRVCASYPGAARGWRRPKIGALNRYSTWNTCILYNASLYFLA
jgi:hypothetical protein